MYAEDFNITKGWQLLGTGIGFNSTEVFNNSCIDTVWTYDKGIKSWKAYSSNTNTMNIIKNNIFINKLVDIDKNDGFWVNANSDCVISFNGGDEAGASTVGNTTHYNTPRGTVTGLVQDTNGNPMFGVKVYIADKATTTNYGGLYTFKNIPVTNTSGTDANNPSQTLSVTIAAPKGYLGANLTVTPSAQIDDAAGSETFIDGYTAQAGTTVLPTLDVNVTGKLELKTSGAPVDANTTINLDFVNVSNSAGANVAQAQNGVVTTYATGNYSAQTDENGTFTISNVPADSDLKYVVGDYNVIGEQIQQGTDKITVTTNNEVSVVNVGDIQVTKINYKN